MQTPKALGLLRFLRSFLNPRPLTASPHPRAAKESPQSRALRALAGRTHRRTGSCRRASISSRRARCFARGFSIPRESWTSITHRLLDTAKEYGWQMRAWAVLANHYHFLADSPEGTGESLRVWLREFHRSTSVALNKLDSAERRRVWFQFRETRITHQTSFLARLRYVNENAVHHKLVAVARDYRWCSAAWFEKIGRRRVGKECKPWV